MNDVDALARELIIATGALRVAALVDRGDDDALAYEIEAPPDAPPGPALHADDATGEVSAQFGVLEDIAAAVLRLAEALGGRSVATATWATDSEVLPLSIAARAGEPLVLVLGERQFDMGPDWPGPDNSS